MNIDNKSVFYQGIVVSDSSKDPQSMGRVQVYIPKLHGERKGDDSKYPWAPCIGGNNLSTGSRVLVGFESNDLSYPLVFGVYGGSSSSNGVGGEGTYSGSTLAEIAAKIIFGNEGGYDTINWNDNGAISIGKIQWHANNARELLKSIREKNPEKFDGIFAKYGLNNFASEHLSKDWSHYNTWTADSNVGKALKEVLGTDESKQVQDSQSIGKIQTYIDNIQGKGVQDPACIIYLADIANQGPAYAYEFAEYCKKNNINNLDSLHNLIYNRGPWTVNNINNLRGDASDYKNGMSGLPRRLRTYEAIKALQNSGGLNPDQLTTLTANGLSGKVLFPCPDYPKATITSSYGWRIHPISGKDSFHQGIDIGVSRGTKIIAVADGEVLVANQDGYGGGWGTYVVIYHPSLNVRSLYAHGVSNSIKVKVGDQVRAGQQIMSVNSTGSSTGNHLHFTMATDKEGSFGGGTRGQGGGPGKSFDPTHWIGR